MFKITAAEKFPRFLFWNERGYFLLEAIISHVEPIIFHANPSYPTTKKDLALICKVFLFH